MEAVGGMNVVAKSLGVTARPFVAAEDVCKVAESDGTLLWPLVAANDASTVAIEFGIPIIDTPWDDVVTPEEETLDESELVDIDGSCKVAELIDPLA